jgi:hypothetical protein
LVPIGHAHPAIGLKTSNRWASDLHVSLHFTNHNRGSNIRTKLLWHISTENYFPYDRGVYTILWGPYLALSLRNFRWPYQRNA